MHELSIKCIRTTDDGVRVYEVAGMLGIEGSTDIQRLFDACLGEGVYSTVFVLEKLSFISSAGVGAFISVAKEVRAGGGDIVFAAVNHRILRVLASLDLLDYFPIYDTLPEALDHFSSFKPRTTEPETVEPAVEVPLRSPLVPRDVLEFGEILVRLKKDQQPLAMALGTAVNTFGIPWMALFTREGEDFFAPSVVAGSSGGIGPNFKLPCDGDFVTRLRSAKNDFLVFPRWERTLSPSAEMDTLQMVGTQGVFRIRSGEGLVAFICFGPSPVVEGEVEALGLLGQQLNWFILYHLSAREQTAEIEAFERRLEKVDAELALAGKKLGRRTLELKTIFRATRDLGEPLAVHDLLNTFLGEIIGQFGVTRALVLLMEGDRLNLKMAKGFTDEVEPAYSNAVSDQTRRLFVEAKKPLPLYVLAAQDPGDLAQRLAEQGMTMVCGLVSSREFLGLLALGPAVSGTDYDPDELGLVWSLSRQVSLHLENARLFQRLSKHDRDAVKRLVAAIDSRDPYTRGHSERVSRHVAQLAQMVGLPRGEIHQVVYGAILHDVGMIATLADATLQDTVHLTEEEQSQVRSHPDVGADILELLGFDEECVKTVRQHHERWDGNGYPVGLAGDETYVGARLVAVADSYDTMISGRRYQQPKTPRQALGELEAGAGSRYDPKVVELFGQLITRLEKGSLQA